MAIQSEQRRRQIIDARGDSEYPHREPAHAQIHLHQHRTAATGSRFQTNPGITDDLPIS
ncbi:hypothetical protein [Mycobacterium basiliense]|uniref:hypothetical protein n=1 Tax=Mycobacterium basiliense TaxID=2094119 RepID=UPI0022B25461|nr:hypothetical protein [Mycobacterium basiliense]